MQRDPAVEAFLDTVDDVGRRADAVSLCELMTEATGEPAAMWGASIIGFGRARYRHASGREGETALVSFSPRRRECVVYLTDDLDAEDLSELDRLGPHRAGRGCLYLSRVADVDRRVLAALVERSAQARRDADPARSAEDG